MISILLHHRRSQGPFTVLLGTPAALVIFWPGQPCPLSGHLRPSPPPPPQMPGGCSQRNRWGTAVRLCEWCPAHSHCGSGPTRAAEQALGKPALVTPLYLETRQGVGGAGWEAGRGQEGPLQAEKGTKTDCWHKTSYQLKTGLPRKGTKTLGR